MQEGFFHVFLFVYVQLKPFFFSRLSSDLSRQLPNDAPGNSEIAHFLVQSGASYTEAEEGSFVCFSVTMMMMLFARVSEERRKAGAGWRS